MPRGIAARISGHRAARSTEIAGLATFLSSRRSEIENASSAPTKKTAATPTTDAPRASTAMPTAAVKKRCVSNPIGTNCIRSNAWNTA